MSLGTDIETALKDVETFAETTLEPWLINFLKTVEKDAVNDALPFIETAGAQIGVALISGQPIAAIGATIADIATTAAANMEKAGVTATAQDLSTAISGYVATLAASGKASTAAVAATLPAQGS